jgi:hypothetical protein
LGPGPAIFVQKEKMLHNVGKIDRVIRLSLALVLVVLYYIKIGNGQYDNYFIFGAVLLLITSMRRCCPVYMLLGFGTCGIETEEKDQVVKPKKIKLK